MVNLYFFFKVEGGIRVGHVTGVQTCAFPISKSIGLFGFQSWAAAGSTPMAIATAPARAAVPSLVIRYLPFYNLLASFSRRLRAVFCGPFRLTSLCHPPQWLKRIGIVDVSTTVWVLPPKTVSLS